MAGDDRRARFEALAELVWDPVRRYLVRRAGTDAEDLHADVLVVLWRRLDDVPAGYELPWAYKIAQGCLANHQRGAQRELRLLRRLRDERPVAPPDEDLELTAALARLKAAEEEVLRLWAWEGLEPRDIAVVLDISSNAAAVRLSRAKAALKEQLGKDPAGAGHKRDREEVPGHD
jgi:RNA polymerase sigma-70 factor (ECF subfamily)